LKRIAIVFGTRPELIKLAPVIRQFSEQTDELDVQVTVVSTGQHRDLFSDALRAFPITIDIDLQLMQDGQTSMELFSRVLNSCTSLFDEKKFDLVVVHGDTGSSAAAALAAHHSRIPVAHVEAGLRSGNLWSPWPEESNRRIVDSISSIHFSPTNLATEVLRLEGHNQSVHQVGNTVVDALIETQEKLESGVLSPTPEVQELVRKFTSPMILVTQHRRENFGPPLQEILSGLRKVADESVEIVFSVHPNPSVKGTVQSALSGRKNVHLLEPVDYQTMVFLMTKSRIILTDSGGLQEEGCALGIPVLVTRDTTERMEGVNSGGIKLVGHNQEIIYESVLNLLHNEDQYNLMKNSLNPFGNGTSSGQIIRVILDFLNQSHKPTY
jgi:UDP-N-acetylglucosamine 2-epimerase